MSTRNVWKDEAAEWKRRYEAAEAELASVREHGVISHDNWMAERKRADAAEARVEQLGQVLGELLVDLGVTMDVSLSGPELLAAGDGVGKLVAARVEQLEGALREATDGSGWGGNYYEVGDLDEEPD